MVGTGSAQRDRGDSERLRGPGNDVAGSETRVGPAPDRDEILRLVHLYTDGIGAHDPAMFEEAFHPVARISFTDADGQLHENQILTHSISLDDPWSWSNMDLRVTARIISLVQAGEVAVVVLGFDANDDPALSWVDIHTLLRIDGTWKIMNKTATHASRAGWAALGANGDKTPATE